MADSTEPTQPNPSPESEAGLLFNRYRVERELGRGGMGRVLLAFDTKLRIHVAVKLVPDQLMADAEAAEDLRREVLRGIALSHPAIVRTHTLEHDATGAAIVMEYVDGLTFTEWKQQQPGLCFDCEQLLPWLGPLCEVLDYAHREARIVHRDLKPRNIMVSQDGKLKVADFGIAAMLSDTHSRQTGAGPTSGTPAYMSPQQARGKKPSHLDDVYSLGATIYDLIAGKPPFFRGGAETILLQLIGETAATMTERREELMIEGKAPIPEHWERTIAACLAKEPADRPQSCGEMLARLLQPASAAPATPGPAPVKPVKVIPPEPAKKPMVRVAMPRPAAMTPTKVSRAWVAPVIATLVIALALGAWRFGQGRKSALATKPIASATPAVMASSTATSNATPTPVAAKTAPATPPTSTPMSAPSATPATLVAAKPMPVPAPPKPQSEIERWLAQVEALYQPRWQTEVVAPYENGLDALKKSVLSALDAQIATASRAAKLQDALAFRTERQRVEADQGVPTDDSDNPPAALKTLRDTWRTQTARIEADRSKNAQTLFTQYDQTLATNQSALTQRQRLNEALQLQHRRDALKKEWLAPPPAKPTTATKDNPFVNSLGMKFVPVPGTNVLFCIHETRRQDYIAFAKNAGRDSGWNAQPRDGVPISDSDDHPAVSLNFADAQSFCAWLSAKEGRTYRLPSDREWSFAVGIGDREDWKESTTPEMRSDKVSGEYPWGQEWPPPKAAGNFADVTYGGRFPADKIIAGYNDGFSTTSPVTTFAPNKFGIYDLGGNMWEWCADWYDAPQTAHFVRGGAWDSSNQTDLLASHRKRLHDGSRGSWGDFGFRCVLELRNTVASTSVNPHPRTSPEATPVPPAATPIPNPHATPVPPTPIPRPANATNSRADAMLLKATKAAPFVNSLGMKFVPVPGTKVLMCIHETRRRDYVVFSKAVSNVDGTWQAPRVDGKKLVQGEDHPVVQVSMDDANAFCEWLSRQDQHTYRLPTEHEWNLAVAIGVNDPDSISPADLTKLINEQYPWSATSEQDGERFGNYGNNSASSDRYEGTAPVMRFRPNHLGIYDLGGNAWEWCKESVLRGCGYRNFGGFRKSGTRAPSEASFRVAPADDGARRVPGFRCVVELPGP